MALKITCLDLQKARKMRSKKQKETRREGSISLSESVI